MSILRSILLGWGFCGWMLYAAQGQDLSLLSLTNQPVRAVLDFYRTLTPGTVLVVGPSVADRNEITVQSGGPVDRKTMARLIEAKLAEQEGIKMLPLSSVKGALALDLPRLGSQKHILVFQLPIEDQSVLQNTNHSALAIWMPRSPLGQALRMYEEISGTKVLVKGMGVTHFSMLQCNLQVPFRIKKETALALLEVALGMQVQAKVMEREGGRTILCLGPDMPRIAPMDYKLLQAGSQPPQASPVQANFVEPPYEGDWTNPGLPGFEVKGRLETEHPGRTNLATAANHWSFYAQVTPRHYFTRLIAPNKYILEKSFDGRWVYQTGLSTAPRKPPVWAAGLSDQNVLTNLASTALVETNLVPYGDAMFGCLWLAYLSRSYLETNRLINPMWMMDDPTLEVKQFQVPFVCLKDKNGLVEELQFLNDGVYYGDYRKQRLPAPYDAGFTNAYFYWNQYTHISGMAVPTEFTFVIYRWPLDGKPPVPNTVIRGVTELVKPLSSRGLIARPQLRGQATVRDRRFHRRSPYLATKWPEETALNQ